MQSLGAGLISLCRLRHGKNRQIKVENSFHNFRIELHVVKMVRQMMRAVFLWPVNSKCFFLSSHANRQLHRRHICHFLSFMCAIMQIEFFHQPPNGRGMKI